MHYLQQELLELSQKDATILGFLLEGSLDGAWYWDLERPEHEWLSPRFWTTLGEDPSTKEHLAAEWQSLVFPEDFEAAKENLARHLEDPSHPYDQVVRYRRRDGSTVWIRCRGIAIRDESGKPRRMLGAHIDITEVMEAQAQIETKEKLLSQILDSSLDGVMAFTSVRDDTGKIIDFEWVLSNDMACEIVGFPRESLLGKRLLQVMPGNKDEGLFDAYVGAVEDGGPPRSMEFFFDHHGITEWFQSKYVKLGDGFVVTFSVVTELKKKQQKLEEHHRDLERGVEEAVATRRRNEELLVHQSKLAAMGEMLGMIAHQWRQPLNAIALSLGTVDLLLEQGTVDPARLAETTGRAQEQIAYLSQTLEDFRNFYGREEGTATPFQVRGAIRHIVELLRGELRHLEIDVDVRNSCGEGPDILGAENQFKQVILAVLQNAKEAILAARQCGKLGKHSRGTITVSVEGAGESLTIVVEDNGIGLEPGVAERALEPYFTTKHPSLGTGTGLYMVKTILERYFDGRVALRNGERGAICTISIARRATL